MITNTYYTGELKIGDFIIVCEAYQMHLGFYRGRGRGNSFQYFSMTSLSRWFDAPQIKYKNPKLCYHNTYNEFRVVKFSPDLLILEEKIKYEKAIEALKLLKIIKE